LHRQYDIRLPYRDIRWHAHSIKKPQFVIVTAMTIGAQSTSRDRADGDTGSLCDSKPYTPLPSRMKLDVQPGVIIERLCRSL
jgi:hypothetical protein